MSQTQSPKSIHIINAPFDKCGARPGSAMGPYALRLEDIRGELAALLHQDRQSQQVSEKTVDVADIALLIEGPQGIPFFGEASRVYGQLSKEVQSAIENESIPIVVGGDHSLSIGSVGGALQALKGDVALLWIDAHADINTPDVSPSMNLHGMPIAALLGLPSNHDDLAPKWNPDLIDEQWGALSHEVDEKFALKQDHVAWIGLRDVDSGEVAAIKELDGCFSSTIQDVDRYGIPRLVDAFHKWMINTGCRHLWISFDVDSLDPALAPGTGTAVRGGLTYREGHLLAEMLAEKLSEGIYDLVGLDVVEINPTLDAGNATAKVACEWVCSLFGKTILDGPSKISI